MTITSNSVQLSCWLSLGFDNTNSSVEDGGKVDISIEAHIDKSDLSKVSKVLRIYLENKRKNILYIVFVVVGTLLTLRTVRLLICYIFSNIVSQSYLLNVMMIPWRDEDDLALLNELHSAKEVLVTGRTYYEHYFPEAVTEYIEYFNNFEIDGSTKNHILLFGLDLGLFLTITRLLMIYKHPSMVIF